MAVISHKFKDDKSYLSIGASLGADSVRTILDIELEWPGKTFDELRFRGASGGHSGQGEVSEFRWFGGETKDEALGEDAMLSAFSDLGFLDGP